MQAAAVKLIKSGRKGCYLFVLKGNTDAEKFYISKGGVPEDESKVEFGGVLVSQKRFGWSNLNTLIN
jgi:hypothetical protein